MCRELGLGWGTVSHHLSVLAREQLVTRYQAGKEVHLYPAAVGAKQARWLSVLGDGAAALIVDHLKREPGARLVELSNTLGVSRKVIRRHLALLDEEGLVVRQGESRPRYHLPPALPLAYEPLDTMRLP